MSHDQLPRTSSDEFDAIVHNDTKVNKKKRFTRRQLTAGVALAAVVAAGGGYGVSRAVSGKSEASGVGTSLGADRYVDYSSTNFDRNNDSYDDAFSDVNNNHVDDSEDTWDSQTEQFVDSREGEDEAAYESASPEDISNMNEILAAYPDMADIPHWVADYVALDDRVKEYMMVIVHSPDRYDSEDQWHTAIAAALDVDAETIESLEN